MPHVQVVPPALQALATAHLEKVASGEARKHGSGYSGTGYKHDITEAVEAFKVRAALRGTGTVAAAATVVSCARHAAAHWCRGVYRWRAPPAGSCVQSKKQMRKGLEMSAGVDEGSDDDMDDLSLLDDADKDDKDDGTTLRGCRRLCAAPRCVTTVLCRDDGRRGRHVTHACRSGVCCAGGAAAGSSAAAAPAAPPADPALAGLDANDPLLLAVERAAAAARAAAVASGVAPAPPPPSSTYLLCGVETFWLPLPLSMVPW